MGFIYEKGQLVLKQSTGQLIVSDLVSKLEVPTYVYDLDGIAQRITDFEAAFKHKISLHYATKANNHKKILGLLAQRGLGADVVSSGELTEALEAGIDPQKIVFSGVGKTESEINLALKNRIKQLNVECPQELVRIGALAKKLGVKANIALRLNPDVNPKTHPYITTGFRENKFGMDVSFLPEIIEILAASQTELNLMGLTMHIGSQIQELNPFVEAIKKTMTIYKKLKQKHGFSLTTFDVGGGLGINYEHNVPKQETDETRLKAYAAAVEEAIGSEDCEILCEPGRILVAPFGILLGQVQYIKTTDFKKFAILNTGMHHLLRPALYQAHHHIAPVTEDSTRKKFIYDIVGPICESSDVVGFERYLPELRQDDWVAIFDTGAYGAVMASNYNSHKAPEEIFISKGVQC